MEIEISDAEIIRSLSNTDIYLLLLLGAENNAPLKGKSICQMEMFLVTRMSTFIKQVTDIDFEWSYNHGPYSEYLSNSLNTLISYMLVKRRQQITLTEKGIEFYNHILETMFCSHKEELETISKVKKQFFSTYNRHELRGYITLHYARDFFEMKEMVEEHDFHRWIESTKNDVAIPCKKAGDIWLIHCACGCILEEREDPTGKVILCDINDEEYKIV